MAIKKVVHLFDPLIREKSVFVDFSNSATLYSLWKDMEDTMLHLNGIGLSAIQIGVPYQFFILNSEFFHLPSPPGYSSCVFINSYINSRFGDIVVGEEGCLSVPDFFAEVKRKDSISISYQDISGKRHNGIFHGLTSICIQHEWDHTQGKLFIDYLPSKKKESLLSNREYYDKLVLI